MTRSHLLDQSVEGELIAELSLGDVEQRLLGRAGKTQRPGAAALLDLPLEGAAFVLSCHEGEAHGCRHQEGYEKSAEFDL